MKKIVGADIMARRTQRDNDDRPRSRRKLKRWHFAGFMSLLAFAFLLLFLPRMLTSRTILLGLIDRFAGIAPLQVDYDQVRAGWLAPISATGLRIKDGDGQVVARIGEVTTEKGILSWIRSSSQLRTIRLSKLEAAVIAGDGTTNWERLLAPLLQDDTETETPDPSDTGLGMSGTIELVDAKFLVTEAGRPEQWVLQVPRMSMQLPTAEQVIGPIEMQATIGEAAGVVNDSIGTITAQVHQAGEAFEIDASLQHVPVDFWHVVHARLPEIPIEELGGRVSARLAGKLVDAERWGFDFQQLQADNFTMAAPELLGPAPARLSLIAATGRASLADSVMQLDNARLSCDVGSADATARFPWPLVIPTATHPFIEGGLIHAEGSIDLAKLAQAARSLMPMREDMRLSSGTAQFLVSQRLDEQGIPSARANLQLSDLRATAGGQQLQWEDPLSIELAADRNAAGLLVSAHANAEFFKLQGGGTIEAGQVQGSVNLDRLQQRLSQWVELPISTMAGSANVDLVWSSTGPDQVEAQGKLTTTPLLIATQVGGQTREPAWTGEFSAAARLADGTPTHLERAKLELTAVDERLTIDLQEPLSLTDAPDAADAASSPAAFAMTLVGDLPSWKRRAMVWLSEPPELELGGNINLAVGGRIDLKHIEVLQANWRSKPIQITTPQFGLSEAEMVGTFKGRVDPSDLTRLRVEALQVQATSFSLGAKDAASSDGNGRVGGAKYLVNLGKLLSNVNASNAAEILPPGVAAAEPTAQLRATGQIDGELQWQVSSTSAGVHLTANAQQLVLLSQAPGATAPTTLWDEANLTARLQGQWDAETGAVDISDLQVRTGWCNYAGTASYRAENDLRKVLSKGQAVVETDKLSTKLAPLTGNQLQLVGQQTVPVDLQWTGSPDPKGSMLAGIEATTRVGWRQARVAGVDVGKADVPVTISAGQLASAAEIPVSGGMLRWDLTSDLTADEWVIHQKPMTVLENVQITDQMSKSWLKYVAPLIAEATSVDGRLSLILNQALLTPVNPRRQTAAGQLVMHSAQVGPGPLSTQILTLVKQIEAIRKKEFAQPVSSQTVWLTMPEQRIDFEMVDGRVLHRNLNVRVGDATISTAGNVDVDGNIDLLATMPIPDEWTDKSSLLVGLRGQSLQFPMRGTLKSPQLDGSALQQLGRQTVQGAAQGLLEKGLSRGLEKLFGAPATPPPTQSTPQP